jgi:short subunit fatty acids transporter
MLKIFICICAAALLWGFWMAIGQLFAEAAKEILRGDKDDTN